MKLIKVSPERRNVTVLAEGDHVFVGMPGYRNDILSNKGPIELSCGQHHKLVLDADEVTDLICQLGATLGKYRDLAADAKREQLSKHTNSETEPA